MLYGSYPLGSVALGDCLYVETQSYVFVDGLATCYTSCDGDARLIFYGYSHDIPDEIPTGIECSICGFEFKLKQLTTDENGRLVCKRCIDK